MHCPRLNHFVRFNPNGSVSRCGHMVNPPEFSCLEEMEASDWLTNTQAAMDLNQWPAECVRCQQAEEIQNPSIRQHAVAFNQQQTVANYLIVGGVLDNICNSACYTCNENLSTKIGSLKSKTYTIVDNTNRFWALPQERIVHLDINGGEPSASKNYKQVLANLPPNVKSVRVNTNCGLFIDELIDVLERDIEVTVTVSLDGIGPVHDYIRWPTKWEKFYENLLKYQAMPLTELNTWTTVSALNIVYLPEIIEFARAHNLKHSWAFLNQPDVLNVKYLNPLTAPAHDLIPGKIAVDRDNQKELAEFLLAQEALRK